MKTAADPRHIRRQKAVKALFAFSFEKGKAPNTLAKTVLKSRQKLDKTIGKCAPEWPIQQINRVDLSILRLALYELMVDKSQPPKVIIDEAVELAKEFGSESSPSFVNGVLGAVLAEKGNKKRKNE